MIGCLLSSPSAAVLSLPAAGVPVLGRLLLWAFMRPFGAPPGPGSIVDTGKSPLELR